MWWYDEWKSCCKNLHNDEVDVVLDENLKPFFKLSLHFGLSFRFVLFDIQPGWSLLQKLVMFEFQFQVILATLTCLKTAVWTIPPATIVPFSRATLKAMSQLACEFDCFVAYSLPSQIKLKQPWERKPTWLICWHVRLQPSGTPTSRE